jgi:ThiF family/Prokaryotic E2 family B
MLKRWWELWPGRLEYELAALDAAGIHYDRDDGALRREKIVLHLQVTLDGQALNIEARFPHVYPYTRFELLAPDLNLPHHQNPISKNLCLIGRASRNWNVDDTLAQFILNRLPLVLKAATSDDRSAVTDVEEHQAEPFTDYYPYEPGAFLLVNSEWCLDEAIEGGEIVIGIRGPLGKVVRGAVIEIRDNTGKTLAQADDLRDLFPNLISGIWFRSETPPIGQSGKDIYFSLRNNGYPVKNAGWQEAPEGRIQVIGVTFPEESSWRRSGRGWIFLVRLQHKPKGFRSREVFYLARAGRAGRSDLESRTPELKPLSKKKIAIVGLGCVGAPSALEFARAGIGTLRLLDHDYLEPGTVSRWPLGLAAAGLPKTEALKAFIHQHYPYTKVETWTHMIGSASEQRESDLNVLENLLRDIDLLYDATAEVGIQHLLSDLAKERHITYMSVFTTPGAWGGWVSRIRPGITKGCWTCLQHSWEDRAIPLPPEDSKELVQPAGCAAPTFTGAGFDIMEVVLTGVRLSVATLCSEGTDGYPSIDWDVGILSLRDAAGRVIPPRWDTFNLERHGSCEACKNH